MDDADEPPEDDAPPPPGVDDPGEGDPSSGVDGPGGGDPPSGVDGRVDLRRSWAVYRRFASRAHDSYNPSERFAKEFK